MKPILKSPLLILYIVLAILHLAAGLLEHTTLTQYSKVLLVPTLMVYLVIANTKHLRLVVMVLVSLLFCWAGDILLLFTDSNELFFLLGLAAFLLGHIFYIISFTALSHKNHNQKALANIFYVLPLIYAITLLSILYPNLGEMTVPVFAYAIVISAMCAAAMWRWHKTSVGSFNYVIVGATLFILSDSLIAINKFHTSFAAAGFLIMLTYIIAQLFIVVGLMKHVHADVNSRI